MPQGVHSSSRSSCSPLTSDSILLSLDEGRQEARQQVHSRRDLDFLVRQASDGRAPSAPVSSACIKAVRGSQLVALTPRAPLTSEGQ